VTSILLTTPLYEIGSQKDRNIASLNPYIGNIISKLLWIPSSIISDNYRLSVRIKEDAILKRGFVEHLADPAI
jgi:hypothetical protein